MKAEQLREELQALGDPEKAEHSKRFFKTGPGQYGEGDRFYGVRVPDQRRIARKYRDLPPAELEELIRSRYHEERLTALFILVLRFRRSDEENREAICRFYIRNLEHVNNWDLVDSSAPEILGAWLMDRPKEILYRLASSKDLWKRRISMLATFHFIKNDRFEDALAIAEILLNDSHDLIHKASGWMLREIGNRKKQLLVDFLGKKHREMPRTMLRYAIEKLPEPERQSWLKGTGGRAGS